MKKISQASIAAAVGVSAATVSRVINNSGYVAKDVRALVERAINELGYTAAKKPSHFSQNLLGLILLRTGENFYFDRLSTAINEEAHKAGYKVIAMYAPFLNNATLQGYAESLFNSGICGLMICGFDDDYLNIDLRAFLQSSDIPIVFIERTAGSYGFNQVLIDNSVGTFYAAKHLIDNGHTHLLYIARRKSSTVETSRLEGFRRAIDEANNKAITYIVEYCPDQQIKWGYDAMQNALEKDPDITGVIVWFDGYAAGAMQYIYQIGRKVPNDIEIVGHDDTLAYILSPPISSIHMPFEEMAASAVEIIKLNRVQRSGAITKTISLEPKLVLR